MDILRYGPDAEVLAPSDLRSAVQSRLQNALELYHCETPKEINAN